MKKKLSLLVAISAMAFGLGAAVGVGANQKGEVKAADATLEPGQVVYLKAGVWASGARMAMWYFNDAKTIGEFVTMTDFGAHGTIAAGEYYYAEIPSTCDNFIFCRMNPAYDYNSWNTQQEGNHVWNQTADLETGGNSNVYVINGWDDYAWGDYNIVPEGKNQSLTFYAGSPIDGEAPKVHAWGGSLTTNTGDWPGAPMNGSTKDDIFFNLKSLYKFTLEYTTYTSNDSDCEIKMILNNGGDSNKTGTIDVIINGRYYYPGWANKWSDLKYSDEMGAAAAVAFELSETSVCPGMTKGDADELLGHLEGQATYLENATWTNKTSKEAFTYAEACKWVDKFATAPHLQGSFVPTMYGASNEANPAGIIILVITGSIVLAGGYFLVRRARKED